MKGWKRQNLSFCDIHPWTPRLRPFEMDKWEMGNQKKRKMKIREMKKRKPRALVTCCCRTLILRSDSLNSYGIFQPSGPKFLLSWTNAWKKQRLNSNFLHTCCNKTMHKMIRGPFLESPETFLAHFGWHNSLCIFETKASRGTKLWSYDNFYPLYNIWKYQLYRIRGSEFYE